MAQVLQCESYLTMYMLSQEIGGLLDVLAHFASEITCWGGP